MIGGKDSSSDREDEAVRVVLHAQCLQPPPRHTG